MTAYVCGRDFYIRGDEVVVLPEPEPIRASTHPTYWTFDAFDENTNRSYLFGDIRNSFVKNI